MSNTLTPSQNDVISLVDKYHDTSDRLFVLWYGGIRAGKTYGMVRAGIHHSLKRENANYIVGGFVLRSIINNVTPYFREICDELELEYKIVEGGVNPRVEIGTNRFLFYGGDNKRRSNNVQGATAVGLLLDEFELLDRDFVKQCEGRISKDASLRIYTSNKGQPYSWAKMEYYDRALSGEIDAQIIDTDPTENIFVGGDFWEEKITEYDDNYRNRFINNEFTLEQTPLYTVDFVDEPESKALDLTILYSYGRYHFTIPVYKPASEDGNDEDYFILGELEEKSSPVNPKSLSRYGVTIINATASRLGRELTNLGFIVRGYSDMFLPHKYELAQRAFSNGNIKVSSEAPIIKQALETHSYPSMNETPIIDAIESGIEYLTRMYRWS